MIPFVSPWKIPDVEPQPYQESVAHSLSTAYTVTTSSFYTAVIRHDKSARALTRINDGDRIFHLAMPVVVSLLVENEGVAAENQELAIFASGRSESEALEDFQLTMIASWEYLEGLSTSELSTDARTLKSCLAKYFTSV